MAYIPVELLLFPFFLLLLLAGLYILFAALTSSSNLDDFANKFKKNIIGYVVVLLFVIVMYHYGHLFNTYSLAVLNDFIPIKIDNIVAGETNNTIFRGEIYKNESHIKEYYNVSFPDITLPNTTRSAFHVMEIYEKAISNRIVHMGTHISYLSILTSVEIGTLPEKDLKHSQVKFDLGVLKRYIEKYIGKAVKRLGVEFNINAEREQIINGIRIIEDGIITYNFLTIFKKIYAALIYFAPIIIALGVIFSLLFFHRAGVIIIGLGISILIVFPLVIFTIMGTGLFLYFPIFLDEKGFDIINATKRDSNLYSLYQQTNFNLGVEKKTENEKILRDMGALMLQEQIRKIIDYKEGTTSSYIKGILNEIFIETLPNNSAKIYINAANFFNYVKFLVLLSFFLSVSLVIFLTHGIQSFLISFFSKDDERIIIKT